MTGRADHPSPDYTTLGVVDLLPFLRGRGFVLVLAGLVDVRPNGAVVARLRRRCPGVRVGVVPSFVLLEAPADLQVALGPQLRAQGISDLWVPRGYYLFLDGELLGHRSDAPPTTWVSYTPVLGVAAVALVDRLLNGRWGSVVRQLPGSLELSIGIPVISYFDRVLDQHFARRSPTGSSREDQRRTSPPPPPPPPPAEACWSNDPFAALGIDATATNAEIKAAHRRRTLEFHPDRARSEEDRLVREEVQRHLNLAYNAIRQQRGF
ncbi:MAG: J domain-containing protein [Myxococcales bacterium]|nr:J domain-containing protein [Myxococcales bacterium]